VHRSTAPATGTVGTKFTIMGHERRKYRMENNTNKTWSMRRMNREWAGTPRPMECALRLLAEPRQDLSNDTGVNKGIILHQASKHALSATSSAKTGELMAWMWVVSQHPCKSLACVACVDVLERPHQASGSEKSRRDRGAGLGGPGRHDGATDGSEQTLAISSIASGPSSP
jgi:hypothetical protein